nr:hypothetical protein [Tanacetum cinerariifolium]
MPIYHHRSLLSHLHRHHLRHVTPFLTTLLNSQPHSQTPPNNHNHHRHFHSSKHPLIHTLTPFSLRQSDSPPVTIIPDDVKYRYSIHRTFITRSKKIKKIEVDDHSALNAPSKTPSTKGTSSSFIDYTPKSPTPYTSSSTNGYLNSPTSPPPRVSPPPSTK